MATKRRTPADRFRERLDRLSRAIADDLRLPSLEQNRLEGYAYLFRLVLPLLNANGKRVFTDPILDELFQVLDHRFGGCMVLLRHRHRRSGDCGTRPRKVRRRKTT